MEPSIVIEYVPFGALGDEWHALVRDGYHADYAGVSEMYGGGAATADAKLALMQRWGGGILAWTAREGGRLIGLLTGDLEDSILTIYDFFVDSAHRRRGLGRALLDAALSEPGVREASAEINMVNSASRALFESLGFEPVRTVSWYTFRLDENRDAA